MKSHKLIPSNKTISFSGGIRFDEIIVTGSYATIQTPSLSFSFQGVIGHYTGPFDFNEPINIKTQSDSTIILSNFSIANNGLTNDIPIITNSGQPMGLLLALTYP